MSTIFIASNTLFRITTEQSIRSRPLALFGVLFGYENYPEMLMIHNNIYKQGCLRLSPVIGRKPLVFNFTAERDLEFEKYLLF